MLGYRQLALHQRLCKPCYEMLGYRQLALLGFTFAQMAFRTMFYRSYDMSKQAETKDLEKFIETLKSLHSKLQWVKMHGSMYQSGVPDVWLMIKRQNIMIEFKKARPRTIARLLFLCRVMQRKRLLDMARLRCPGFILCSSPDSKTWAGVRVADLLQEDLNVKLEYVSIEEMAKFLLDNV